MFQTAIWYNLTRVGNFPLFIAMREFMDITYAFISCFGWTPHYIILIQIHLSCELWWFCLLVHKFTVTRVPYTIWKFRSHKDSILRKLEGYKHIRGQYFRLNWCCNTSRRRLSLKRLSNKSYKLCCAAVQYTVQYSTVTVLLLLRSQQCYPKKTRDLIKVVKSTRKY